MSGSPGWATMERFPRARGPHSILPWNQPTISPRAIAAAVRRCNSGSATSSAVITSLPARTDWISASLNSRPV